MRRRAQWLAAVLLVLGACMAPGAETAHVGQVRWRWRPPPPASVGAPAADALGIAVTYSHTTIVSLAREGRVQWETRRLGVREAAPLLLPGTVLVPADDGLVAIDRATGSIRWDTKLGDAMSTPVVAGHVVLACASRGSLVAVDPGTGAVLWNVPLEGRAAGPPATDGRTVVATWEQEDGDAAGVTAVAVASGAPRWTAPLHPGGVSGAAVVPIAEGHALAVAVDDDLAAKAFDLGTGRQVWSSRVGGAGEPDVPPLALPGGRVLVADREGDLSLFGATGTRVWSSAGAGAAAGGAPVGPTSAGVYALVLYNGTLQLAGPHHKRDTVPAPGGLANGVALAPDGSVLVSSAQGDDNQLIAYRP